jgi:high-affinity iron transporter
VWAEGLPNLLIGLREGLEAGLVVSILLAAVRKAEGADGPAEGRSGATSVWLGVLAATVLAVSFGAVLTYSEAAMSTLAREAFSGALSVIAVGLVTAMIFWMRRTARSLSGELRSKVDSALRIGGGALALTAFLAVAREGLETALFLWTTVQAAGHTVVPLGGAVLGLAIASGLCWLLYRRAVKINLGTFFSRTAVILVVIAAGVLAYGLGDLQDAGVLPGHTWLAFDLSAHASLDTWWVSIISAVTNLRPAMTWLQVAAYIGYLGAVLAVLHRQSQPVAATPRFSFSLRGYSSRSAGWTVVAAAVVLPVAAAAVLIGARPRHTDAGREITITASACAPSWKTATAGQQTFTIVNSSSHSGEIYLLDSASGGVVGELAGLGPGTTQTMPVTLSTGDYVWRCLMAGEPARTSTVAHAAGTSTQAAAAPVAPVSTKDLEAPVAQYQTYVATQLATLTGQVAKLRADVAAESLDAARADWLPAQLTWEQVGAAYGSFADIGDAIGGQPTGLPGGAGDPDFTGLHRVEYGLWHGQRTAELLPVLDKLTADIKTLRGTLTSLTVDPADLPLRAHEILEDALRDHLTGATDQGAGAGFAETWADAQGTRVVLDELASLITARRADLVPTATKQLDTLTATLQATRHNGSWTSVAAAPLATRQAVNAAIGALLETLAPIPDLLEVRGP